VIPPASCSVVADTFVVSMAREEEQEEFFDSRVVLSPASVSSPASSGRHHNDGWLFCEPLLDVWVKNPSSVHERRQRFVKSLGLLDPSNYGARPDEEEPCSRPDVAEEILPVSPSAEVFSAVPSFACRGGKPTASDDGGAGTEELECVFKNLDDGTVFVVDEMGKDGSFRSLREKRSNRTVTAAEFEQTFGSSPFIRQMMQRVEDSDESSTPEKALTRRRRKRKLGWLRRLGISACVVAAEEDDEMKSTSSSSCRSCSGKVDRVKVRPYKKRSKELSAVYKGQVIKAHEGAIVTMKFSSDGQYLATGGEDGVVRVWQVMEGERPADHDFVEDDPSCVFFTVNENSELTPINSCDGGKGKHNKSSKGAADPACVVIPRRTFALSEDPVHEFYGHNDVILDLSWSKNRVS
jgi:hypothetical protein